MSFEDGVAVTTSFVPGPSTLVVCLLLVFVGLLLTYRHQKARDRHQQKPGNDEEKTKKESRGKKLFSKFKVCLICF